ncbi:hypothetical protein ACFX13_041669 [Malus domestica]|uniref:homeobox-leucine zipper protein ATHB-12-like n=1 Tax=Malus domestica TaxID=3750 RepID=UPI000498EF56|nr:homeobox-leucine zipper protein ATHB-12-like [Malus domestica]
MLDQIEYSSPSAEDHETFSCMSSPGAATTRRKNDKNKKRFSDEQIRSLESIFESESRLEPRKKMQLAKELGLQPRQVSIWFQNKRARWKSKQLEREYSILRANYNNLASKFEAMKKEKQALVVQVQKLNNLMMQRENRGEDVAMNSGIDGESDNGDATISESDQVKLDLSVEKSEQGELGVLSDDDSSIKAEYFGLEDESNLVNLVEYVDGSLTSAEDWRKLNSDGLFDESTGDYQWWDFWS